MSEIRCSVVVPGEAVGPILRLAKAISFWGGVDPASGRIIDPRHPDCGRDVTGTILALPATIGSSSSSAIMLELVRHGTAPAGLILGNVDAILTLGVIVGEELGYPSLPVVRMQPTALAGLPSTGDVEIRRDGIVVAG